MKIQHTATTAASVLTLTGDVRADDADLLRGAAYEALTTSSEAHRRSGTPPGPQEDAARGGQRAHAGDLLVDARAVTSFDDAAVAALSSARTRARYLGAQVVVVDQVAGALSLSLRRTGLAFRFPRFDSPEAAAGSLEQARLARARSEVPVEQRWRAG